MFYERGLMAEQQPFGPPKCDGPSNRIVAMNDGEDPSKEFIYAGDLVQVTLTLLHHFQDIQAEQVCAAKREGRGWESRRRRETEKEKQRREREKGKKEEKREGGGRGNKGSEE